MDAAFLDRFVYQDWPIDEALELATSGNPAWCKRVQDVRRKVTQHGIDVMVTPRATYYGASLLNAGIDQSEVELSTLRKGMTDEQWNKVA